MRELLEIFANVIADVALLYDTASSARRIATLLGVEL